MTRRGTFGCLLAVAVLGGAAWGSINAAGAASSNTVDIYSSLPLQGSSTAQTNPMVNGIRLALAQAHGKAGKFTIKYQSLDDSTASAGKWDPAQCAANARKVAVDSKAIYYIGEFNSGCSEISVPILNTAGVPQVSPANTYPGLTVGGPGTKPGEPTKFYPTRKRTYLRIVPIDSIQAAADLIAMKQAGCKKVAVANDKEVYGQGLATLLGLEKGFYGVTIASNTAIDPTSPNFRTYAATIKSQGANCFFFAGIVSNGAVQITKDVNSALPKAKIFGGDGVCTSSYTAASQHGVPANIARLIECTVATQNLASYPGGVNPFLRSYRTTYHVTSPDPYAIYGYEDMKLALDTIASLGSKGSSKSAVLQALFAIKARKSVLGTYGFNSKGDTTLKSYGLYKVDKTGTPVFFKKIVAPKVVASK